MSPALAQLRLRAECQLFLVEQQPSHALTLAFNDTVALPAVRRVLGELHARIDRVLLGRRFHLQPPHRRTWFAAFVENVTSNTHAHLVARVAADRHQAFEGLFPGTRGAFWSRWAPRGTYALAPVHDAAGWAGYATKFLRLGDEWIMSSDYLPAHALAS